MPKKTIVAVFLGPPGSGKGTQGKELAEALPGVEHVATGDLFRNEIARKTPLGQRVESLINAGNLVPDDLTYEVLKTQFEKIIRERSPNLIILDGYPRNGEQVRDLVKLLKSDPGLSGPVFFELRVSKEVVVDRISGRLVNPRTGRVYHTKTRKPRIVGVCDEDGGELIQRADDKPQVVAGRYDTYQRGLSEMLDEIRQGNFQHFGLDAGREVSDVFQELRGKIETLIGGANAAGGVD